MKKKKKIIENFKYVFDSSDYDLYDDEELIDNDNYDY